MRAKRYGSKRSADATRVPETVTSPSQKMILGVFQQTLSLPFVPSVSRVITGIVISSSIIGIEALKPVIAIYQQHALVYCSAQQRGKSSDTGWRLSAADMRLALYAVIMNFNRVAMRKFLF